MSCTAPTCIPRKYTGDSTCRCASRSVCSTTRTPSPSITGLESQALERITAVARAGQALDIRAGNDGAQAAEHAAVEVGPDDPEPAAVAGDGVGERPFQSHVNQRVRAVGVQVDRRDAADTHAVIIQRRVSRVFRFPASLNVIAISGPCFCTIRLM